MTTERPRLKLRRLSEVTRGSPSPDRLFNGFMQYTGGPGDKAVAVQREGRRRELGY